MVGNKTLPRTHNADEVGGLPEWGGSTIITDKGILLLLLYEKAIECMTEAKTLIAEGDFVGKCERLIRAQEIVLQLTDALEKNSGDEAATALADNLEKLYLYIYVRLFRGNIHLDCEAIDEAKRLMMTLYEAWEQIVVRENRTAGRFATV